MPNYKYDEPFHAWSCPKCPFRIGIKVADYDYYEEYGPPKCWLCEERLERVETDLPYIFFNTYQDEDLREYDQVMLDILYLLCHQNNDMPNRNLRFLDELKNYLIENKDGMRDWLLKM